MKKILILGGGFGGVRAALDLGKKFKGNIEVNIIDKKSYHFFVPALYEVASAYGVKKDPFAVRLKKTICIPYSDIFKNKNVNFIQAEINAIDIENKKVITGGGEILGYDYLIIALGSKAADFGIPGVKEYAFQFKNLEDGLALNQKIDDLTKEIASSERTQPIKISVIGAGFTGIEVAAELACCVKKMAKVCGIKKRCERIILLEASSKILPMVSEEERHTIVKRLTKLGVEIMKGVAVEEIGSGHIKLKNGKTMDTDVAIWTAGLSPLDMLNGSLGIPLTENKKIKVGDNLEVVGLSGVFAVGDNMAFPDPSTGRDVPALAYVAADQGRVAAENVARLIKEKDLKRYNPFSSVWIAPIGGKYALAHLWGGINIKGFWGWVIREMVDFKYMLSILSIKKAVSLMWQEITLFVKND